MLDNIYITFKLNNMKNLNIQMTLFVAGLIAFVVIIAIVVINAQTVGINMTI